MSSHNISETFNPHQPRIRSMSRYCHFQMNLYRNLRHNGTQVMLLRNECADEFKLSSITLVWPHTEVVAIPPKLISSALSFQVTTLHWVGNLLPMLRPTIDILNNMSTAYVLTF